MEQPTGGFTVLVLESDESIFLPLREHLLRAGFRVLAAANGWEALRAVKEDVVDAVLSDTANADLDGCSLREKLLLNPATREVPFIFLAPDEDARTRVAASRLGADDCLARPFDPVLVVAKVQALLERRRVYEEMVRVDALTRVLNRQTVEREVREDLARTVRYGHVASLTLVNMDGLGAINTDYGQALGDLLLSCLGSILICATRSVDIIGRYRGDVFVVYLPETNREGAEVLTGRLLERFAAAAESMSGVRPSLSAGIVEAPRDGIEFGTLVARAAKAVHHAKQTGKGRAVAWTPDMNLG